MGIRKLNDAVLVPLLIMWVGLAELGVWLGNLRSLGLWIITIAMEAKRRERRAKKNGIREWIRPWNDWNSLLRIVIWNLRARWSILLILIALLCLHLNTLPVKFQSSARRSDKEQKEATARRKIGTVCERKSEIDVTDKVLASKHSFSHEFDSGISWFHWTMWNQLF